MEQNRAQRSKQHDKHTALHIGPHQAVKDVLHASGIESHLGPGNPEVAQDGKELTKRGKRTRLTSINITSLSKQGDALK